MNSQVQVLIDQLELLPHPEGGFYKESYRSEGAISGTNEFPANRAYSTGIYFLLHDDVYSSFHRIKSDEMWHFYEGQPLEVLEIDTNGVLKITELGRTGVYQYVVKAGNWFASRVKSGVGYALVGCTVSPGFDFHDFELANDSLLLDYPNYAEIIRTLLIKET